MNAHHLYMEEMPENANHLRVNFWLFDCEPKSANLRASQVEPA